LVAGPHFAVSLAVYDGKWPRGPMPGENGPRAADLAFHTSVQTPVDVDSEWGPEGTPCEYLGGRLCYGDGSGLQAEAFYRKHGHGCADETEGFWLALEAEYIEQRPRWTLRRVAP
jgi:hypothetical protein